MLAQELTPAYFLGLHTHAQYDPPSKSSDLFIGTIHEHNALDVKLCRRHPRRTISGRQRSCLIQNHCLTRALNHFLQTGY